MTVLVTGSAGLVGGAVCALLAARGHIVVGFDLAGGDDVRNPDAVLGAARGCEAVVHCAALLDGGPADRGRVMATNVHGTWHVLEAARRCGVDKVVVLSSVDALGLFKGERAPDYLPLDESHPCYPRTPYGISKRLGERLCRDYADACGLSVVCLRPPGVWTPDTYGWIARKRRERADFEWSPFWEYGAFVDVRDLAAACVDALQPRVTGCHTLLVAADDITTSGAGSRALCRRLHPTVEWRGGVEYDAEPMRTLVSNTAARRVLGWRPIHTWAHSGGAPPAARRRKPQGEQSDGRH